MQSQAYGALQCNVGEQLLEGSGVQRSQGYILEGKMHIRQVPS